MNQKPSYEDLQKEISTLREKNRQLQKEKDRLKTTLNSIADGVITTDEKANIESINPVAENLTGWNKEEAKGQSLEKIFSIVNMETKEKVTNPVSKVLKNGQISGLADDTLLISKQGDEYKISDLAAPIKDDQGKIKGVVLVFRDITEKYEMQEELKEQEKKYRLLFENMSSGIAVYKPIQDGKDFEIVDFNKTAETIEGVDREEIIGKKVTQVFPAAKEIGLLEVLKEVWATGQTKHLPPASFEDNQQNTVWRENWVFKHPSGLIVTIYNNVTELKKAKEKLEEREKKYRAIFNNANDAMYLYELKENGMPGQFVEVNDIACEMLGYTKAELNQMSPQDIDTRDSAEEIPGVMNEIEENQHITFEMKHKAKNGKKIPVEISSHLFTLDEKKYILSIARDIAERKKKEEKLKEKNSRLETLFGNLPGIAYRCKNDENWTMKFVSQGVEELTGYKAEQIIDNTDILYSELIKESDQDKIRKKVQEGIEKNRHYEVEYRIKTKQGKEKWVWERGKCVVCDTEPEILEGFISDITTRKQAQEKFQSIWQESNDGMRITDEKGTIIDVNQAFCKLMNKEKSQLIGESFTVCYNKNKQNMIDEYAERFDNNKIPARIEKKIELHNNQKRWFEVVSSYIFPPGESRQLLSIFRDITKQKEIEQKLRKSKREKALILDNTSDLIVYYDQDFTINWANQAYLDKTGLSLEEIKGAKCYRAHGFEGYCDKCPIETTLSSGIPSFMQLNPQDQSCWSEDQGYWSVKSDIVQNKQGKIVGAIGIARDITERKQMEEDLKQSEDKYRAIIEKSHDGIYIRKGDKYIFVNDRVEEITGYDKDEIYNMEAWEIIHPSERDRVRKIGMKRARGNQAPSNYEVRIHTKQGETKYLSVSVTTISYQGEQAALGTVRDITKRKQMEKELRQSEQKYKRLVETTGDIILIHNSDGVITFVNQSTLYYTKYTEEEILGKNIVDFIPEDEIDSLYKRKRQRQDKKDKSRWNFEAAFLDKEGERIEVDVQATPLFENNEYKSSLIVARDITERKQAQKEKEELQEQLYQKQKLQSIGTLAGGIAHDFNNLLTVILGMADMAIERAEMSGVKSSIKEVRNAGEKAAKLTDQLLLFSREKDTEFQRINLNKTVENLETMLKRLIGEDISIHDEFEDNIWEIRADEGQIEQVITNIAINARDAMPEGGDLYLRTQNIFIDQEKAQTTPEIQSGSYVQMEIEDTGGGMDEKTQDKIFDPFFTTKGRAEGTGMGLSVVHGIVKNHDGLINVYSEPGEGSVFKIYFPAIKKQEETQEREEVKENLDKYSGHGETILVVEDERPMINYIEQIFDSYDYSYFSAETAEEALDIYEENREEIDLLFSDMILPGMKGLELADKLKEEKSDLDIILSSGYSDNKISSQEVRKKGYRFVRKPFDIRDLLQSIYEAIHE